MQRFFTNSSLGAALSICVALCAVGCTRSSDNNGNSSKGEGLSIQNTGSDTMVNLAQAWAEVYATIKPEISIEVAGGGSGVGIRDLMQGTVDIANASRKVKAAEAKQVKANTGKDPIEHVLAFDGIGVYVHKDNPLEEITLAQLAEIYKENGTITKWSQLGVNAACPSDEIVVISRQSNSGTYVFFRDAVLSKGDFRLGTRDMHGSKDVVDLVEHTPCAIGYSGMGYKIDGVKFLKVKKADDAIGFVPNPANVLSGDYPIARPLQMYTIGAPTGHIKDYLEWILSSAGQKIVVDNGYVPLSAAK